MISNPRDDYGLGQKKRSSFQAPCHNGISLWI